MTAIPDVSGFRELVANEPTEMRRHGLRRSGSVFVSASHFPVTPVQVFAKKMLRYTLAKKARVARKK